VDETGSLAGHGIGGVSFSDFVAILNYQSFQRFRNILQHPVAMCLGPFTKQLPTTKQCASDAANEHIKN
jgi:hypothetical protein